MTITDNDHVYLDAAACPPLPRQVIEKYCSELMQNDVLGNPHSDNPHSSRTEDVIAEVRDKVLSFLDADQSEYEVVFTSNATAGFKLIAENYCWYPWLAGNPESLWQSYLLTLLRMLISLISPAYIFLLSDNHTSALGMRLSAIAKFARYIAVDTVGSVSSVLRRRWFSGISNSLFVFPAQSNFNGCLYPLEWINQITSTDCHVLLDASMFCAYNKLSLRRYPADFVVLSFYKIFGFPTGIGAIVMKKATSSSVLQRSYFGGGTLDALSLNWHVSSKSLSRKFEDGTLNYHGILALKFGFEYYDKIGSDVLFYAVDKLYQNAAKRLQTLAHSNNNPMVKIYFTPGYSHSGIINFNLLDSERRVVSCDDFKLIAKLHNISCRTGSFCNAGALQKSLGINESLLKLRYYEQGNSCNGSFPVFNDGTPSGAIRISFNYENSINDIDALLKLITKYFQDKSILSPRKEKSIVTQGHAILENILIYPIKSCGGCEVKSCVVSASGIEFDRIWKLVSLDGKVLTQKTYPRMALIRTRINKESCTVSCSYPDLTNLDLPLKQVTSFPIDEANHWFSTAIGTRCTLAFCNSNFVNRGAILMVNRCSLDLISSSCSYVCDISSVRPNLIINSEISFIEDAVSVVEIGNCRFDGGETCKRCAMINVDQKSGKVDKNVFSSLCQYSSEPGFSFGRYLNVERTGFLQVNQSVRFS